MLLIMKSINQENIYSNLIKKFFEELITLLKKVFVNPLSQLTKPTYVNYLLWTTLLIAIFSRIFFLSDPIRIDEAGTFLQFVKGNPLRAFYYPSVNNHILHSLLIKISTFFTGVSPASIRLTSFLSGIFSIFLTYILSREFKQKGLYASLAMATTPYLIFYSTFARSYSFTICITLAICLLANNYINDNSRTGIIAISIFSSIGLLTIPTMVLPITGIYSWIFLSLLFRGENIKKLLIRFLLPTVIYTAIITFILYLPTLTLSGGIDSIINAKFTEPIGLIKTIDGLPRHFTSTLSELNSQIPIIFLLINGFLIIIGFISYFKKNNLKELILFPSFLFSGLMVLLIRTILAHERSWIFLIPFSLIVADEGYTFLTQNLNKKYFKNLSIILIFIASFFCRSILDNRLIDKIPFSKTFPEAPIIVKYLRGNIYDNPENYNININESLETNLFFYTWYYKFPIKINGISFKKSDSPFEWVLQAKKDFEKYRNMTPKRQDIRDKSSIDLKQIYVENEGFKNRKSFQEELVIKIFDYGKTKLYKEK